MNNEELKKNIAAGLGKKTARELLDFVLDFKKGTRLTHMTSACFYGALSALPTREDEERNPALVLLKYDRQGCVEAISDLLSKLLKDDSGVFEIPRENFVRKIERFAGVRRVRTAGGRAKTKKTDAKARAKKEKIASDPVCQHLRAHLHGLEKKELLGIMAELLDKFEPDELRGTFAWFAMRNMPYVEEEWLDTLGETYDKTHCVNILCNLWSKLKLCLLGPRRALCEAIMEEIESRARFERA